MLDIRILLGNRTILFLAVSYTCLITVLLLMPSSSLPRVKLPSDSDKVAHLFIHTILVGIWLLYLIRRSGNGFLWRHVAIVMFGSLLFGILIEVFQEYLTVSRTADFFDVLANLGGAAVGVLVFLGIRRFITP